LFSIILTREAGLAYLILGLLNTSFGGKKMANLNWQNSFSDKERDRRWQLVREFLQNKGADALLVLGAPLLQSETNRTVQLQTLDRYLSDWACGCTIIFPLKGEPTLLGAPLQSVLMWTPETPKEELPWIEDIRVSAQGETIVAVLKEKGLERGRVIAGNIAPTAGGAVGPERVGRSWGSFPVWGQVVKALPDCNFENLEIDLTELVAVKSEEELAMFRRCSEAMEQATIAIVKTVRPGATELDIHLAIEKALWENGAVGNDQYIASGPTTTQPGGRLWNRGIGSPRVLEPADMVNTGCIFARIGGIEAQGQQSVAIPPVSPENERCARIARECYEEGLRTLRPGIKFKEVVEAMAAPLEDTGAWTMFPRIHNMNPQFIGGWASEASERRKEEYYKEYYERFHAPTGGRRDPRRVIQGEVVLKPGMVFEFEPEACIGRHRVVVGSNVIVTEEGNEPLNEMGTRMRLAGEV